MIDENYITSKTLDGMKFKNEWMNENEKLSKSYVCFLENFKKFELGYSTGSTGPR